MNCQTCSLDLLYMVARSSIHYLLLLVLCPFTFIPLSLVYLCVVLPTVIFSCLPDWAKRELNHIGHVYNIQQQAPISDIFSLTFFSIHSWSFGCTEYAAYRKQILIKRLAICVLFNKYFVCYKKKPSQMKIRHYSPHESFQILCILDVYSVVSLFTSNMGQYHRMHHRRLQMQTQTNPSDRKTSDFVGRYVQVNPFCVLCQPSCNKINNF